MRKRWKKYKYQPQLASWIAVPSNLSAEAPCWAAPSDFSRQRASCASSAHRGSVHTTWWHVAFYSHNLVASTQPGGRYCHAHIIPLICEWLPKEFMIKIRTFATCHHVPLPGNGAPQADMKNPTHCIFGWPPCWYDMRPTPFKHFQRKSAGKKIE